MSRVFFFVFLADVDWKKLKNATRPPCLTKNVESEGGPNSTGRVESSSGSAPVGSVPAKNSLVCGSATENAPGGDDPQVGTQEEHPQPGSGSRKSYREQCKAKGACVKKRDPNAKLDPNGCGCLPKPAPIRSKLPSSSQSAGINDVFSPTDASGAADQSDPPCPRRRPISSSGPSGCRVQT